MLGCHVKAHHEAFTRIVSFRLLFNLINPVPKPDFRLHKICSEILIQELRVHPIQYLMKAVRIDVIVLQVNRHVTEELRVRNLGRLWSISILSGEQIGRW